MKKDKHSVVITDMRNLEIVNIRFINPLAFTFTGNIRLPDGSLVEITLDHVLARDRFQRPKFTASGFVSTPQRSVFQFSGPPRQK